MTDKTKKISYKGYKNILNRVAYKLVKSDGNYKHEDEYTVGKNKKTYKEIIKTVKENKTNIKNDAFIARFIEDVILKNKKTILPRYVMGASGVNKYSRASYCDMVERVVEYRNKNKKNPSKITVSYEVIEKLHDYMTSQGCSGMGQCTPYYCGCNSLQQAFYRLTGIKVDESTIASVAGTTSSGTDHDGLNTAVAWFNKKYDKNVEIVWYNFNELGNSSKARWSKINSLNKKGAVFFHLLYRNQWGHYEGIKSVGTSLKILNSLGDKCGTYSYCGYVETRSRSTQESYIGGISQKSVAYLYNG